MGEKFFVQKSSKNNKIQMNLVVIEKCSVPTVPVRFYPFLFHGSGSGSEKLKYFGSGSVLGSKKFEAARL